MREAATCEAKTQLQRNPLEEVIRCLRSRPGESLSLDAMAEIACLSRYYFIRMFRAVTGLPPARFLTVVRMDMAKHLLLNSDMKVTEICFEVGYRSLGTFERRFSELVGLSPGRLRQLGKQPDLLSLAVHWIDHGLTLLIPQSDRCLNIQTRLPDSFHGFVFACLSQAKSASRIPVASGIGRGAESLAVPCLANGQYVLGAVAIEYGSNSLSMLMNSNALRTSGTFLRIDGGYPQNSIQVEFREPRITDPPVLPVLPIIILDRFFNRNGTLSRRQFVLDQTADCFKPSDLGLGHVAIEAITGALYAGMAKTETTDMILERSIS